MRGYANYYRMEHLQDLSPQQDVKKFDNKEHTWYGFKTHKPFRLIIFRSFTISHFCVF